jgi:hypothetical protein
MGLGGLSSDLKHHSGGGGGRSSQVVGKHTRDGDGDRYFSQRRNLGGSRFQSVQNGMPAPAGYGAASMDTYAAPPSVLETANTGVIISEGRRDPLVKQSLIVQTVTVDPHLAVLRKKTPHDQQAAPVGRAEDLNIARGSLVFDNLTPAAANIAPNFSGGDPFGGFGARNVHDCVNGLPKGTMMRCAGVINTSIALDKAQIDPSASLTSAGTDTLVLNGPKCLRPGDAVGWLGTPFVTRGPDGHAIPAIQEKGIPAGKFRPMILPMTDIASTEVPMLVYKHARKVATEGGGINSLQQFKAAWKRCRTKFRNVGLDNSLGNDDRTLMMDDDFLPLDLLAGYVLLEVCMSGCSAVVKAAIMKELEDEFMRRAKLEIQHPELQQDQPFVVDATSDDAEISLHIGMRKMQCTIDHYNWVERHRIGISMSPATPGGPFDIMIGYH